MHPNIFGGIEKILVHQVIRSQNKSEENLMPVLLMEI